MKIKTITCHDVYNYGAALQAYALQKYLITKGHDVEIIDYKPDYMRIHYNFWYVPESSHYYNIAMKSLLFRFLLCCYFAPKRFSTLARKYNFDKFVKKKLYLTRRFFNYQELKDCPPEADMYIAGSDQIWNSSLPNGQDPAYFLQFGKDEIKRISYAASFAISTITEPYKSLNKQWLSKFQSISVREHTGLMILKDMGLKGTEVLDPVFLLNKDQWNEFSGDKRCYKDRYILVYDLYINDGRLKKEAERLFLKTGFKIISVDASVKCPYSDVNISNAGPIEFVNLIKNAEFVITNSFHATSFSIIFNKAFSVFYQYGNISRISDMLSHLDLKDKLNNEKNDYSFKWDYINNKLDEMSYGSRTFLIENLKN